MASDEEWNKAQRYERHWWVSNPQYHPGEVIKSNYVAKLLFIDDRISDRTVIDIGCGPLSLLQQIPTKSCVGLDPIHYGDLEKAYESRNIKRIIKCGEDISNEDGHYDEAWIYNCLQHVKDPTKIIENAIMISNMVRIFEWTYIPPYEGHLWELRPEMLSNPFQKAGWHTRMQTTGYLDHSGLSGNYFVGIFTKEKYDNCQGL